MLKEKLAQVKAFAKDHKKEIAIGIGVLVGGTVVYKIVKSSPKVIDICETIDKSNVIKDLEIPKTELGTINELWQDGFGKNLILNDVTVGDLGKVGEEFLKIDGVTNETVVTAVVGLLDEVEVTEF
jgi:hypothetical protein